MGNIPNSIMNILNGKRTVANPASETCAELYERLNAGYGMTLRNFQERFNARSETRFGMKRVATAKEVAAMEALYPPKQEKLKRVTAETPGAKAPPANLKKKNPTDWIRVLALVISGGIVGGHGVLIWYDCSLLWSKPGFIAGLIIFLMIVFGMLSMASRTMKGVVENVAWFVWMLEGVAIFVHVPSFTANASQAYARGLGELHIWLLSAIICVCSIGATYFYKQTILIDVKPDKK